MNKIVAIFALLILFLKQGNAQSKKIEFGNVTLEELQMSSYNKDSAASAVILFDKAVCTLNTDLNITYKRHTRIKFFTKESIEEWASLTLNVDRSSENVSKIKASVYNLENGVRAESKLDETSVFKTRVDRYTEQVKFTLPNVKEGSVIEYSYMLSSQASLLPDWQFQYTIPSMWSEYEVSTPSTFAFEKDLQGFLDITDSKSNENHTHETWIMKDVPAFKIEPFLTTPDDYVSKLTFHISQVYIPGEKTLNFRQSWPGIVKNLNNEPDFGGQIRGSNFLKKNVEELTKDITEPNVKVRKIYDFVRDNVEWNEMVDKIPDHTFKKVLEDKKGSSSEINLLLVCMLRKAGFEANAVLLSTRANGQVRVFNPRFTQFNDVICQVKVDDKTMLLDGTDRNLPITALPERCLNGEGLVVLDEGTEWVPLVSQKARTVVNADLKVDESGAINGKLTIAKDGLDGGQMRKAFKGDGQEKYVSNFAEGKSWQIEKSEFTNVDNTKESVKEIHDLTISDHAQSTGAVIYLNPYLLQRLEDNPLKSEVRNYPVDFSTPFDKFYLAKIEIPVDFQVEEMPQNKIFLLPENAGKFVFNISQTGNTLNLVSQLTIAKSVFLPDQYVNLREFYARVVAKQAEQIVLKKK